MMEKRIQRIRDMEALFDRALALMEEIPLSDAACEELQQILPPLEAYYTGPEWIQDYLDDGKGLFPRDLKRGVLSQDGVWNLLCDYDEQIKK